MTVIRTRAVIGSDRMLHVDLPEDAPTGPVEVELTITPQRRTLSAEERRAAAEAGAGALRDYNISTEEFLAERREDEIRRERALGS